MALPVFFLCMMTILNFGRVMETAVQYSSALCETGEKMAAAAYASEYGEKNTIISGGLSAVYARSSVLGKVKDRSAVKNENFLLSSFLKEEDMIHLVLTYQAAPVCGIKIPGTFFLQRASVRGWTGRSGSDGSGNSEGEEGTDEHTMVYVTEHGSVYHKDLQCTHIKLSIQKVEKEAVSGLRNHGGEKYHSCEKCGKDAGGAVYITAEGNRYHSSLECSGLKRTVKEVSLEELGEMRPCSKCGG